MCGNGNVHNHIQVGIVSRRKNIDGIQKTNYAAVIIKLCTWPTHAWFLKSTWMFLVLFLHKDRYAAQVAKSKWSVFDCDL